jgi:hypothetical protein
MRSSPRKARRDAAPLRTPRYIPPIATDYLSQEVLTPWECLWAVLILLTGGLNLPLSVTQSARTTALMFGVFALTTTLALFTLQ